VVVPRRPRIRDIPAGQLAALHEYGSRARRKGRAAVSETIRRALAGGPNELLPLLKLGGRPPSALLTADPSLAAAVTVDLMAQQSTFPAMAAVGALGLGVIAHAVRQSRGAEDNRGRQTLGAYLRAWWDYRDRARALAFPNLLDALSPPVSSSHEGLSPAMRAGVADALVELALVLCTAPPDWIPRLRLCEGPKCRRLYYLTKDPAATGKWCSNRCRQAAFRARHPRRRYPKKRRVTAPGTQAPRRRRS
jgi:hypothetical protein